MIPGLNPQGFVKKTFEEIRNEIGDRYRNTFGTIDLDSRLEAGSNIDIYTEREAEIWEALEGLANAFNPDTATDYNLDNIALYHGVKRLAATATTVVANLIGVNQTTVPAGSIATGAGVNSNFELTVDTLITNENCLDGQIFVIDDSYDEYIVVINGVSVTYEKVDGDTVTAIRNGLSDAIIEAALPVTATAIFDDGLLIKTTDETFTLSIYVIDGLDLGEIRVNELFTANTLGRISVPIGALNTIQSPVYGWYRVYNTIDGETGRNLETDEELRIRRDKSVKLSGTGTPDAITARLLNIAGVSTAKVIENITLVTVDDLPGKSYKCLIAGGDNTEIAAAIWKSKPAGTETVGTLTVLTPDINGNMQPVKFSRPTPVYIFVTIVLTTTAGTFPANGIALIKEGIFNKINSSSVNQSIIYQSLFEQIYSVPGITNANLTIGSSYDATPPVMGTTNIAISSSEVAITDNTKINIT